MSSRDSEHPSEEAFEQLPCSSSVFALCDLDEVPMYIDYAEGTGVQAAVVQMFSDGPSNVDTSYQLNLWEIAYVWSWPMDDRNMDDHIRLEKILRYQYGCSGNLVNCDAPKAPLLLDFQLPSLNRVQLYPDVEIEHRRHFRRRFVHGAFYFARLTRFVLRHRHTDELYPSCEVHFNRLVSHFERFRELFRDDR